MDGLRKNTLYFICTGCCAGTDGKFDYRAMLKWLQCSRRSSKMLIASSLRELVLIRRQSVPSTTAVNNGAYRIDVKKIRLLSDVVVSKCSTQSTYRETEIVFSMHSQWLWLKIWHYLFILESTLQLNLFAIVSITQIYKNPKVCTLYASRMRKPAKLQRPLEHMHRLGIYKLRRVYSNAPSFPCAHQWTVWPMKLSAFLTDPSILGVTYICLRCTRLVLCEQFVR